MSQRAALAYNVCSCLYGSVVEVDGWELACMHAFGLAVLLSCMSQDKQAAFVQGLDGYTIVAAIDGSVHTAVARPWLAPCTCTPSTTCTTGRPLSQCIMQTPSLCTQRQHLDLRIIHVCFACTDCFCVMLFSCSWAMARARCLTSCSTRRR